MPPMVDIAEGAIIVGRYRILRPLSAGGMDAVLVAEQISTKKERALEVMQSELVGDPKLRARLKKLERPSAKVAAALESLRATADAGVIGSLEELE